MQAYAQKRVREGGPRIETLAGRPQSYYNNLDYCNNLRYGVPTAVSTINVTPLKFLCSHPVPCNLHRNIIVILTPHRLTPHSHMPHDFTQSRSISRTLIAISADTDMAAWGLEGCKEWRASERILACYVSMLPPGHPNCNSIQGPRNICFLCVRHGKAHGFPPTQRAVVCIGVLW